MTCSYGKPVNIFLTFLKKKIILSIYFSGRIDFAEDEAFVKKTYTDVSESPSHFKKFLADPDKKTEQSLMVAKDKNEHEFTLPHPIWSHDEADSVKITHRAPKSLSDRLAYFAVMTMRTGFDLGSGYTIGRKWGTLDERSVLIRCIFLETVAGMYRIIFTCHKKSKLFWQKFQSRI